MSPVFGFNIRIGVPRWLGYLFILGFVLFLFWNGTPVARWILLLSPVLALCILALHRVFPGAVNAVMEIMTSEPPTEEAGLAMLFRGTPQERNYVIRMWLGGVVLVVCLVIGLMALAFLQFKTGQVVWIPAVTHWAENTGTTNVVIIVTELKEAAKKAAKSGDAPAAQKSK